MENQAQELLNNATITLLREMIATPSFSKEESVVADLIFKQLTNYGLNPSRSGNNVYAKRSATQEGKPTLLLNSHLDTVRPNSNYTRNPFEAKIESGRLYGLGSNDAGASVVTMIEAFRRISVRTDLPFHVILALTAEEEISGKNGIESLLPELGPIEMGIVGEPTQLQAAICERGLLVLDCVARGVSGHAAGEDGINAIHLAASDINFLSNFEFPKVSEVLGKVKITVTSIESPNKQHNVIPSECRYIVDIRLNELYTHEEVIRELQKNLHAEITPRSTRIKPSHLNKNHPLVIAAQQCGCELYGSPTTSDQALMSFPTIKIGPGDSRRSHMADEYVFIDEILAGADFYEKIITTLCDINL